MHGSIVIVVYTNIQSITGESVRVESGHVHARLVNHVSIKLLKLVKVKLSYYSLLNA